MGGAKHDKPCSTNEDCPPERGQTRGGICETCVNRFCDFVIGSAFAAKGSMAGKGFGQPVQAHCADLTKEMCPVRTPRDKNPFRCPKVP